MSIYEIVLLEAMFLAIGAAIGGILFLVLSFIEWIIKHE